MKDKIKNPNNYSGEDKITLIIIKIKNTIKMAITTKIIIGLIGTIKTIITIKIKIGSKINPIKVVMP